MRLVDISLPGFHTLRKDHWILQWREIVLQHLKLCQTWIGKRDVKPSLNKQAVFPISELCQWLDNCTQVLPKRLSTIADKYSWGSSTAVCEQAPAGRVWPSLGGKASSARFLFAPSSTRELFHRRGYGHQQYCCWIFTLYSLLTACNSLSCSEDFLATQKKYRNATENNVCDSFCNILKRNITLSVTSNKFFNF